MMNRSQRDAVVLSLVNELKEKESWCGETHIQKATYFLQELLDIPLEFEFILYKHGPFSFDLRDEITAMRADSLLQIQPMPEPYGPRIVPSEASQDFLSHFPRTLNKYAENICFVAEKLAKLGVAELERLATALYVTQNLDGNEENRALQINELKPHIKIQEARIATQKVDEIIREVRLKEDMD